MSDYAVAHFDEIEEINDGRPWRPVRDRFAITSFGVNAWTGQNLAGRTAEAIEHLRLAIDRSERFRSLAASDSDFDPIRDEPGFKELVPG